MNKEDKMSLICVACGKTIIMSGNPDHLGCCAACGNSSLTEDQKKQIKESNELFDSFRKKE
jgi:hypothetical protein